MATILLSAVGAALGGGIGGGVLGITGAVLGRAAGATLGRALDQRLLGAGSASVEVGRVERFRLMGASEGAPIPQVWGRFRVGGQVIWASQFQEHSDTTRAGGGKGGVPRTSITEYSYTVHVAVALCEGPILHVGRIWADGNEISPASLTLHLYTGTEDQLPDARIEAVEGAGNAPAYRGLAYVVIEDLDLGRFGNRVPQFSFEVIRPTWDSDGKPGGLVDTVRAVALIPGTGEYALATTKVRFEDGPGVNRTLNVNTVSGGTDFAVSLAQLRGELPNVASVSLVVSWFGDDLRCNSCLIKPKVEQKIQDSPQMPWQAGGITRAQADLLPMLDGRVVYGGTPTDQSVIQAIQAIRAGGQKVMFYPFVLMTQMSGNTLPEPWTGGTGQPVLPWRGRITLSVAPGRPGSPDLSAAAEAEVAAFFGTAAVTDFSVVNGRVTYSGPDTWGYRRFILHNARLCAAAGGVDAFCIGSELRGLTQIRGVGHSFPAVAALRQLAADVRLILGQGTKITYAADWSEYFGHHTGENVYFHLDPLWADPNIDAIGIDNYMPISDWRPEEDHADSAYRSGYAVDYLKANIAGGEGFEWYYASAEAERLQIRTPIEDGAYAEPWVFRFKDLKSWWKNAHYNRIDGVRAGQPTPWVPESKPIWFTEYGCPALDGGSNQPNLFVDPKSSESALPRGSRGHRDDYVQMQYFRAMAEFWADPANNPASAVYAAPMVDMTKAHAWAWDARPFPAFPTRMDLWSDGHNYNLGHWLNGRSASQPLDEVVREICRDTDVPLDLTDLAGVVRGYAVSDVQTARASLQPLSLAYGFDAVERAGTLAFLGRGTEDALDLDLDQLAQLPSLDAGFERVRQNSHDVPDRATVTFVEDQGSFPVVVAEASQSVNTPKSIGQGELGLLLLPTEGRAVAARWLAETHVASETIRFAVPPSRSDLTAGGVVRFAGDLFRIDNVETAGGLIAEAVRIESSPYAIFAPGTDVQVPEVFHDAAQPYPFFLDLPLLPTPMATPAPYVSAAASPWPGPVAVWDAREEDGFRLNTLLSASATVGVTESPLLGARPGLPDRGAPLRVFVPGGELQSAAWGDVLDGANLFAIGDGTPDNWEIFQAAEAVLAAENRYDLSLRLRGQFGTDALMPAIWPVGSRLVKLDTTLLPLQFPADRRGALRTYRIGLATRGYADEEVITRRLALANNALRPLSPVHLHLRDDIGGQRLTWVRRTRVDGDSWVSFDVPLGEERELYVVRTMSGSTTLREDVVATPDWLYPTAQLLADAGYSTVSLAVAQVSAQFGPGLFATLRLR